MKLNRPILGIAAAGFLALTAMTGCGSNSSTSTPDPQPQAATTATRAPRLRPDQDIASLCNGLARKARAIVEQATNHPSPRLSTQQHLRATNFSNCRIGAKDVAVRMTLDTAEKVKKRYDNRITESQQFSSQTKGLFPHPVGGVGDLHASGGGANWLPAFNELLSIRGNHMLAMNFYIKGVSKDGLLDAATKLALATWAGLDVPRHQGSAPRKAGSTPKGF